MSFAGHDFEAAVCEAEDDAVLVVDADTPPARKIAAKRLGVADAVVAVSLDALQKRVDATNGAAVARTLPGQIVVPAAVMPDLMHGGWPSG